MFNCRYLEVFCKKIFFTLGGKMIGKIGYVGVKFYKSLGRLYFVVIFLILKVIFEEGLK